MRQKFHCKRLFPCLEIKKRSYPKSVSGTNSIGKQSSNVVENIKNRPGIRGVQHESKIIQRSLRSATDNIFIISSFVYALKLFAISGG